MKVAREGGALLSYYPNIRLPLWPLKDQAREGILSIWNEADLIEVSDEEVNFLTGGDPTKAEVVMTLWHPRLKILVVTHGKEGWDITQSVESVRVKAIDTLGAGDAFIRGLISKIVKDPSILEWAPCHVIVAVPLFIEFELMLCTYLDSASEYGILVVNLKLVFLPLIAFEILILVSNFSLPAEGMTIYFTSRTIDHLWNINILWMITRQL